MITLQNKNYCLFSENSCRFQKLNNVINQVQETEWEESCVCDGEQKGNLPHTTKEIVNFAGQFVEFQKNDLSPFDLVKIPDDYVVGENKTGHRDFERVMLRRSAK